MNFFTYNELLSKHASFKVGGVVDILSTPKNLEELRKTLEYIKKNNLKWFVLGNGSNLLIKDSGYKGVCIKLSNFKEIEINDDTITVDAGALMSTVGNLCLKNNLSGFETLCGIPGTIGGGVYMNAGAYGFEISDILIKSTYMTPDGEIITLTKEEHDFSYRHSFYSDNPEYIILQSTFKLIIKEQEQIKELMDDCRHKRQDKQPLNFPSAGSTFKRPIGHFAGKLIEDAGLKGYTVGGASVSSKHSGFVVNHNKATSDDILQVISDVQKIVFEKFGIELECEVKIIGE